MKLQVKGHYFRILFIVFSSSLIQANSFGSAQNCIQLIDNKLCAIVSGHSNGVILSEIKINDLMIKRGSTLTNPTASLICRFLVRKSDAQVTKTTGSLKYALLSLDKSEKPRVVIKKNSFFKTSVITEVKCSGFNTDKMTTFNEKAMQLARGIVMDAYDRIDEIKFPSKYIKRSFLKVVKNFDLIKIKYSTQLRKGVWASVGEDNTILTYSDFYNDTLVNAASTIIHEASHFFYAAETSSSERIAVQTTQSFLDNSLKSNGFLVSSYSGKFYGTEDTCGWPIVIKSRFSYNNTSTLFRSNNWIGGKSICKQEFAMDINGDAFLQFMNIYNKENWSKQFIENHRKAETTNLFDLDGFY